MSEKRLSQRIRAKKIGVAELTEHVLCFHKTSKLDGSAKCDIIKTGNSSDIVLGVVYDIEESQKPILDMFEGLGFGYDVKTVSVTIGDKSYNAFTYYATSVDPSLKPYKWYVKHVLEGARENCMPSSYIKNIEKIDALSDADTERRERELSIYL